MIRKVLCFVGCLALCIGMVACGNSGNNNQPASSNTNLKKADSSVASSAGANITNNASSNADMPKDKNVSTFEDGTYAIGKDFTEGALSDDKMYLIINADITDQASGKKYEKAEYKIPISDTCIIDQVGLDGKSTQPHSFKGKYKAVEEMLGDVIKGVYSRTRLDLEIKNGKMEKFIIRTVS